MVKILIVDDVPEMLGLLHETLRLIPGIQVSGEARNGPEARLEVHKRRPDLILLDEILPGESSADLIVEYSALKIPVLMLTGVEDPSHPIPRGARGRLIKPGWDSIEADRNRFKEAIFRLFPD